MLNNVYKSVIQGLPLVYLYLKASFNTRNEIIDFEILEANKIFADQVASHPDSLTGKILREVFPQLTTDDLQWMIQQALNLEENQDFELTRFCNISNRWFKINIFCQQKYHLVFVYDDITLEQLANTINKDIQKQQKALFELTSSAHYIDGNIYDFIRMLTAKACQVFDVWRAGVWFFDENGEKLRCFDNYDAEAGKHSTGHLLEGFKYNAEFGHLKKYRYVDANDALQDERIKGYMDDYLLPLGITSMLDVGISVEGQTKGILCIEHRGEKRTWNQHEINFACQLADQVAIVLGVFDKKVARNQHFKSQALLKSIFLTAPSGMGLVSSRVFQEVNDKLCRMTGYRREELVGKSARILYPSEAEYDYVGKEKYRQIDESGVGTLETRWKTKKGKIIDVLLSSSPMVADDLSHGVTFTATDITQRKLAEQKLKENEWRLRQLATNIPGVVYQFQILPDGQFRISYMSNGGIEIFNRPLKQLYDYSKLFEDVCPEHKRLLEKSITEAAKTFSDWDHEFCITTPKGIKKWLRGKSKPRKDGEDGILWDGVLMDISLQKKAEDKLRQSEERFQSIVQSQQEMICRFLPDTTLTFVNQAYCNYFGKKEADLLGKKFLDYLPQTNLRLMKEHLLLFTPDNPTHVFENEIAKDDNNSIWQEWNTYAIFNEEGQVVEFQAIGNDITDKKKNLQLEQELQIAIKSARFKKNFLANMSHEMRTPLTGIIGMTEILSSTKLSNQQKEYVEVLKDSGENLMEIINQVLDFSKIEAGKVKMNFRPLVLKALLENTEKLFYAICSKNIEFEGRLDSELPACIEADQGRIEQIINNLMSNAIKFTAKGKITLEVKNEKLLTDNELLLKISVCDTGIGLSAQQQKNIFEPFVQADDKDTRAYEGTGLGLTVSKNLASLHGGEIGFESEEGKGSCFWFTFKAKYCKNIDVLQINQADVAPTVRALKILYAEDKQVNQKVVKLMLRSLGHEVTLVDNGQQALEAYAAQLFDLILMDIQMPVMDGISAVKKLRETHKNLPPIVGLSANAFEGDQQKYMAQGMDAYLTKPVKRKDLEAMLKSFFPAS